MDSSTLPFIHAPKGAMSMHKSHGKAREKDYLRFILLRTRAIPPMKSSFLAMVCVIWLLVQFHSFAETVFLDDLILVENPVSAEQLALSKVETAVRQNPTQAPDIVTKAIHTEVPHPVPFSCEIVRAAIAGFGKQITRIGSARLVYAAVKASPAETLSIVNVAIEDTPPSVHQDIVSAAIAAVPNPYDCVSWEGLHLLVDGKRCLRRQTQCFPR